MTIVINILNLCYQEFKDTIGFNLAAMDHLKVTNYSIVFIAVQFANTEFEKPVVFLFFTANDGIKI